MSASPGNPAGPVVGLACYTRHASAAAVLADGRPAAAAGEERFVREKNIDRFPSEALAYGLREARCSLADCAEVAFAFDPWMSLRAKGAVLARYFPKSLAYAFANRDLCQADRWGVRSVLAEKLAERGWRGRVRYVEHHAAHAASAFFPSGFERAAILTLDGKGEYHSTWMGAGEGTRLRALRRIPIHHSLGLLYSTVTAFLGFRPISGEGKVMALAALGKPVHRDVFRSLMRLNADGSFSLDPSYFDFTKAGVAFDDRVNFLSAKFRRTLGPPRSPSEDLTQHHLDVAASLQERLEEAMVHLARGLRRETGCRDLCMAGGVALNCVANGRVLDEAGFDRLFVQAAADDSGTALGAALFAQHHLPGAPRGYEMRNDYLGPEYSDAEIERALAESGLPFERVPDVAERTAALLAEGRVVAWFQGRMEYGPRALGARSILADPRDASMKDRINAAVKFREPWQPFAPSVLAERAADLFERGAPSPFMLLVDRVKPAWRAALAAVTHEDGTARLHTVAREENPRYHDLIAAFERRTGVPAVLDTSLNVREEPIILRPEEAVACLKGTAMDALAIGDFLVLKPGR